VPISEDLFTHPPRLTRREREILELLASGRTTEDIAGELVLSVATIR
jgi:DNA-binding NarL/FixJ family response regulator